MNAEQLLKEIRRIDNVIHAYRNLITQAKMVNLDPRRLTQYHQDLNEIETRMHHLIHSTVFVTTHP